MIDILLIDDDPLVVSSLKTILEADENLAIAGTGHSGVQAIQLALTLHPDIILMDIRMEPMSGLVAGQAILEQMPAARILFLTTFADDEYIIKALRMGARGYILKQHFSSIVPAVKAICSGQTVFGDQIMSRLPILLGQANIIDLSPFQITGKEAEIIQLIAEGLNNKEIAARLYISEGTVRNHLTVILDKLGLRDRTQLAIMYLKGGM